MPHTPTAPPPTQPNLCPLCAMRPAGGAADSVGRYSLTHGSQFRCSACDAWLCADCGDTPVPGEGARCEVCAAPQEPQSPPAVPPLGVAPVPTVEETCIRRSQSTGHRCQKRPADWPVIAGEPAPVAACLAHLSEDERADCLRARKLKRAEEHRSWAAGEPERQRLAAQEAAAKRALQEAYPCGERRPEQIGMYAAGSDVNRCQGCESWLCASCNWVHVAAEAAQCQTCRPQDAEARRDAGRCQGDRPYYRIKVPGLESFEAAVYVLIRAGARYGGGNRTFAVDLPICASQAQALEDLAGREFGSDGAMITVKLVPEDAEAAVAPDLPEPDLSGLADIHTWWGDNAYPPKEKQPVQTLRERRGAGGDQSKGADPSTNLTRSPAGQT